MINSPLDHLALSVVYVLSWNTVKLLLFTPPPPAPPVLSYLHTGIYHFPLFYCSILSFLLYVQLLISLQAFENGCIKG
jgi:hypothetical protein